MYSFWDTNEGWVESVYETINRYKDTGSTIVDKPRSGRYRSDDEGKKSGKESSMANPQRTWG